MKTFKMKIFIAIAALLSITNGKSYENFQTLRVETPDHASREKLTPLESSLSIWSDIPGRHVDVMVDPIDVEAVKKFLKTESLNYRTMIPNIGDLMRAEKAKSRSRSNADHNMSWDEYHSLADIQSYIDYLVKTFPNLVQQETIGTTFEKRPMNIVKICKGGCGNKPAVWIDGGIHAREWISPAAVTYMLRQLAEVQNPADADLLDKLDWYILPVTNPDGYEFTMNPKGDRMWRKTRSINAGSICKGVDANRNFGFHFNEGGSSPDPCSDAYHGTGPFSEKETQNVRDFINAHNNSIKFFSSIHSFSQFVLLPWGFTEDKPSNYDKLLSFANNGNAALKSVNGLEYTVGCIPCILYVASGGSIDWTLGVAGIPYSLAMELRDTGLHGFLLPPDQIIPTGEETWAFHKTGARQIIEEFGNHGSSSFNVSILAYTLGLTLSAFFGRNI